MPQRPCYCQGSGGHQKRQKGDKKAVEGWGTNENVRKGRQ